jgi:outer membrane protein assembly factor BamB
MNSAARLRALALAGAFATSLSIAQTTAPDPLDAVLGQWRGVVGTPDNHTDWAIEIKRNAQGVATGFIHHQEMNFFGLDVGEVKFADGQYVLPPFGWPVKLVDGKLVGRDAGPLKMTVDLARTDTLPTEVPIPALPTGPGPRWQVKLGGGIYAPAAVRDGVAYVGTTGGTFNAVSLQDGKILWAIPAGRPVHGEALVTDEHLFFACDNGFLFKLARADGKEVWRYDLGDAQAPRVLMHPTIFFWDYKAPKPALADGVLYLGAGDGSFHAVNADSGQRVWRVTAAKDRIRTDALVVGDKVVFGSFDQHLYALRRADGTEVWKRAVGAVNTPITLVAGKVAFGSRGTILAAVDPETGKTAWRSFMWGSSAESGVVQFGDFAYAGSSDLRRLTAFEAATGKVIWRTDIFGIAWPTPAVTEKIIYTAAGGYEPYQVRHVGGLLALDRATGKILWRWPAPKSAHQYEQGFAAGPTLAGDMLVIGSMDGTLYGFPLEN